MKSALLPKEEQVKDPSPEELALRLRSTRLQSLAQCVIRRGGHAGIDRIKLPEARLKGPGAVA
jgi:hypothetical protein